MTKYIPLLLMSTFVFCQTIKEDLEFYDNGQSRVQIYKNMDLETVKRNTFDAKGKLLSSFNYDPAWKAYNALSKKIKTKTAQNSVFPIDLL